jgi:hypothetical protein
LKSASRINGGLKISNHRAGRWAVLYDHRRGNGVFFLVVCGDPRHQAQAGSDGLGAKGLLHSGSQEIGDRIARRPGYAAASGAFGSGVVHRRVFRCANNRTVRGVLYLFDPAHFIPFTGGLLVLGVREYDEHGVPNVGIVVLVLNAHAYLLGATALALPYWIAVATTVSSVLLLTGREQLHNLARRVEVKEIITAGQFLTLTGLFFRCFRASRCSEGLRGPNEVTIATSVSSRRIRFTSDSVAGSSHSQR